MFASVHALRFASALSLVVGCAPTVALAAAAPQARPAPYHAPRDAGDHADLSGLWSDTSMTPENRGAGLGDRLVYTAEEVAKLEDAAAKEEVEGNRRSDPNAGAPAVGGDKPAANIRPEFAAAGGAVGGYDRGWLDPGNRIMRVRGEPRTSIITTPNGRVPAPKAGAQRPAGGRGAAASFDNPENRSLGERCIIGFGRNAGPPMLANGFYNNNYQFVQTRDELAIVVEMVHDVRHIRIGGQHPKGDIKPWMGDSIGHWEGETLVVETTNIPQGQAYYGAGRDLTVTERFTRLAADRLLYQYTITDPTIWEKPWGGEYEFSPLKGQVYEYACHEGNYALPGILAGARKEEADAKAKVAKAGA